MQPKMANDSEQCLQEVGKSQTYTANCLLWFESEMSSTGSEFEWYRLYCAKYASYLNILFLSSKTYKPTLCLKPL